MAEVLSIISIVSFVIAGISLIVAVVLWFRFDILNVIGDLSGRTAKKSIAQMRAFNEKSGKKTYKPSQTNTDRGKLTDTMQHSSTLKETKGLRGSKKKKIVDDQPATDILDTNRAKSSDLAEQTALLVDDATDLLGDATSLLDDENATALLDDTPAANAAKGKQLTMLDEVIIIHTREVI